MERCLAKDKRAREWAPHMLRPRSKHSKMGWGLSTRVPGILSQLLAPTLSLPTLWPEETFMKMTWGRAAPIFLNFFWGLLRMNAFCMECCSWKKIKPWKRCEESMFFPYPVVPNRCAAAHWCAAPWQCAAHIFSKGLSRFRKISLTSKIKDSKCCSLTLKWDLVLEIYISWKSGSEFNPFVMSVLYRMYNLLTPVFKIDILA